jgi:hypothetical protein
MSKHRGVLLLELALAMVFISVALVGLFDAFRSTTKAEAAGNMRSQARLLLEWKVEEIAAQGVFREGVQDGLCDAESSFRWESEAHGTEIEGLYRATISILWRNEQESVTVYLRERT